MTDSVASILFTEKCWPISRKNSIRLSGSSHSALLTSWNWSFLRNWASVFSMLVLFSVMLCFVWSDLVLSFPEGSPICVVPPPITMMM